MLIKKFKTSILSLGIVTTLFVSAAYAAYSSYTVTLPSFKGDVTLKQGSKSTSDDYIKHKNISLGGNYDAVNVWIEKYSSGSWSKVSDKDTHYEGQGPYTVYASTTLSSSDTIRVRGENHDTTYVTVQLSGEIDLR